MFTMILLYYLQQGREVTLESTGVRGAYRTKAECEAAAVRARGPLPAPRNYAAAWQDARCIPIDRDVRVNDMPPTDMARLLREQPAEGCQGASAWQRMADNCAAR
jgi:hypothetical protein